MAESVVGGKPSRDFHDLTTAIFSRPSEIYSLNLTWSCTLDVRMKINRRIEPKEGLPLVASGRGRGQECPCP